MSTFQIKKESFIGLRGILLSEPFNSEERAIQYAVQFALKCGIKCNVYHSDKNKEVLSVVVQNKEANIEIANLLEFHISTLAIG